ncbi:MAG: dienelactone hydrolase family protein [Gemmatimonadales bacterium]
MTERRLHTPAGAVSALLEVPQHAFALLVLAHGAGAGMRHAFMADLAAALAEERVGTLRYQFPYMEAAKKRPDRPPVAMAAVQAAVRAAGEQCPELPRFVGGKSFGGRMSSQAVAEAMLEGVSGLVFFGFPLHAPKRPGTSRADHLAHVRVPMLFLQGSRDAFADLELLRGVLDGLPCAPELHVVPDADHSFKVPKRAAREPGEILAELAARTAAWMHAIVRQ